MAQSSEGVGRVAPVELHDLVDAEPADLDAGVLLDGILIYAGIKLFRRFFGARRDRSQTDEPINLRATPALPRALPNYSGD